MLNLLHLIRRESDSSQPVLRPRRTRHAVVTYTPLRLLVFQVVSPPNSVGRTQSTWIEKRKQQIELELKRNVKRTNGEAEVAQFGEEEASTS